MTTLITGTQLFNDGKISVHKHTDGYSITFGTRMVIVSEMPPLQANHLYRMISDNYLTGFDKWQEKKKGNIYQEKRSAFQDVHDDNNTAEFDRQLSIMEQASAMYQLGY